MDRVEYLPHLLLLKCGAVEQGEFRGSTIDISLLN